MQVEIRTFVRTPLYREFLQRWKDTGSQVQLLCQPGAINKLFLESDPEYPRYRAFVEKHKEALKITYHEYRWPIYSEQEKRNAELLAITATYRKNSVDLKNDYEHRRKCVECGRPFWRVRKSNQIALSGIGNRGHNIFQTDAGEIVVSALLKEECEANSIRGATFSPCQTGADRSLFFELSSSTRIGAPVISNNELTICSACKNWFVPTGVRAPAEMCFFRKYWNGEDVVLSAGSPGILVCSQKTIALIMRFQPDFGYDKCQPIALICS